VFSDSGQRGCRCLTPQKGDVALIPVKLIPVKLKAYTVISKKKSHGLTQLELSRDVSHDPGFDWPWVAEKVRRATTGRGRRRARASA
jgi:hypothetical protein